ncbi:hypothetical protein SHLO109777_05045 [Shewanella loihica]|uniref:Uncharacterized protein n=1 Tax=Shewanella loihica (strain ATCC BAA-1088 / PV-4) TaxID=323850 RepID=A3QG63_SHELP|nr:hypothetical protein [Shewanella loihica]ABO24461.1 hypothetical protein Shew_2595 [Shewanella loihica PV-4]
MEVIAQIYPDRIVVSHGERQTALSPSTPFTTRRLLVGNFSPAEQCLKQGLNELGCIGLFKRPRLVIQPMAMCEGGLSEIEERCLMELCLSAGARDVRIQVE